MNSIQIIGNLTKDPEGFETKSEKNGARLTVAVNNKFQEEHTDYFNVTVWGNLAEVCVKHLSKGKKVAVVGRMESRTADNKTYWGITANEIEFLTPKTEEGEAKTSTHNRNPEPMEDDGLPF